MHKTVLSMARVMIFQSALQLKVKKYAGKYAKYNLNRRLTNSSSGRASPLEGLTKKAPNLRRIVVFGLLCTVYRDPSKNFSTRRAQVGWIVGCGDETKGS